MNVTPLFFAVGLLLGVAAPRTAWAIAPPALPPCAPVSQTVTAQALGVVAAGTGDFRTRECAANALEARGVAAVPVLVRMLDSEDDYTLGLAMGAVAKLGTVAAPTMAALLGHLKALPRRPQGETYKSDLYEAIGALGPAAVPAIPILIKNSSARQDRYLAVTALGKLGKYDAERVVPHLVSIIRMPREKQDGFYSQPALQALEEIGPLARREVPTIIRALERAKAVEDSNDGTAAIRALAAVGRPDQSMPVLLGLLNHPVFAMDAIDNLGRIGPAASTAVPALINKLRRSHHDPHLPNEITSALYAIAPKSLHVKREILREATLYQTSEAGYVLALIRPLPADFAPALKAALAKKPHDPYLVQALRNAVGAK